MKNSIDYGGKKICYQDRREGHAIVLLHGFLEDMSMWDYFVDKLSKTYRVITIDLPGFGESDCLDGPHSMDNLAHVVEEVLDHCQIEQYLLIGHSMGGYVTLAFAALFPEKLKGICLFHSHALGDSPEQQINRDRVIAVVEADKGNFIFSFFPDLFAKENIPSFMDEIDDLHDKAMKLSPEAIIKSLEGMKKRESHLDVLVQADFPVMFILGKQDSRIPFERVLAQAALPKRGEILVLDGVGHMGHMEARDYCLKTIEGFAKKVF